MWTCALKLASGTVAIAALSLVITAACRSVEEDSFPTTTPVASPTPTVTSALTVVPSPTPPDGLEPINRAIEQIQQDWQKPRFEGELGPFLVISPRSEVQEPAVPCPEPLSEKELGPEDGDTYFVLPDGTTPGGTVCANGLVLNSMASYPGTKPDSILISKWRFGGDEPYFRAEAPRERLELTTIGGRPALIVHPAQSVFPDYRLAVIQKPGMMLQLSGLTDLPGIVRLAEDILAQGGE